MRPSELPDWVRVVAVDTETNELFIDDGSRIAVVSIAYEDPDGKIEIEQNGETIRLSAWAFPFAQGLAGKPEASRHDQMTLFAHEDRNLPPSEWLALLEWLNKRWHIYHNAKFDLHQLRAGVIPRDVPAWKHRETWKGVDFQAQVIWDTQLVSRELWPTEPTSLKTTASRLWGVDQAAEQRALKAYLGPKDNPRFDLVPWEVMEPYATQDAILTLRLALHQWQALREGVINAHWIRRELAYMRALYRMETRGLPYDASASLAVAGEVAQRKRTVEQQIPFRTTEPAAKDYFYGERYRTREGRWANGPQLVPHSTTEKGNPQLTAEVITRILREYPAGTEIHRVARAWQDWNKLDTANSMWYEPYARAIGPDGRLRTSFRQSGTRSDRLSCERINLQAIPHDYRLSEYAALEGLPTPRQLIGQAAAQLTGWELWEFDLAQAELRVAALWAECERMLGAIREGRDLHSETAQELFGVDQEHPEWGKYRQIGKRGNFTLCFGAGGATFRRMVAKEAGVYLGEREADRIVADWNALYPEFKRAIDRHSWAADRQRWIGLANGRCRHFAVWEDTHKAFNQRVQASLAEFQKDWTLANERFLTDQNLDERGLRGGVGRGGLLLTIHDSQVCLLPAGRPAEAMAADIRQFAVDLWAQYFPGVPGDAEGKRW